MAIGDSKADLATGFVIGLGVSALAPGLAPALAGAFRPVAKQLVKSVLLALEKGRDGAAELGELFEDLVAEASAELEKERAGAPSASSGNGADPAAAGRSAGD